MNTNAAVPLHQANMEDDDVVIDGTQSDDDQRGTSDDENGEGQPKRQTNEAILKAQGLTAIQSACYDAIKRVETLAKERELINSKITAIRDEMETKGISKKAFNMVLQIAKMNEDHLDGFDTSFLVLRKAISLPVQSDMFNI